MTEDDSAALDAKDDSAFSALTNALKQPFDEGGGGNGGDGGSGGGGSGGGDGGDGLGRLMQALREGLSRVGERQSDFTAKLVEAAFARVMETLTARFGEFAGLIHKVAEQAVRGDEAVVKQLGEAVTKSISKNADVAEHCAKLADRLASLEREVAALKRDRLQ
jgi:hypothetical protein